MNRVKDGGRDSGRDPQGLDAKHESLTAKPERPDLSAILEEAVSALESHSAFAVTMLRAMLVGLEMNKNVRGWTKESSDHAEKCFVEALADHRQTLTRIRRGSDATE